MAEQGLRKTVLTSLVLLIVLGGALRLVRLGDWPAFVDEDMYTTAAVEMTHLGWPDFVLHSTDADATGIAKTPLLFMGQAGLIELGLDPLVAGRLLSAIFGVVAIPLAFLLGRRIGGDDGRVGLATAALYAVLPVSVLHDRMVLQDGPMSTLLLAAVLTALAANDRRSANLCVAAAALAALAVQAKVSAIFGAIVLVRIAFLGWRDATFKQRMTAFVPAAGAALSYVLLQVGPTGHGLATQNAIVAGTTPAVWANNVSTLADAVATYFPLGLWLLAPIGHVVMARRDPRSSMLVLWAVIALCVPWLVLSRGSPTRYYLAVMPYLCVLVAQALTSFGSAGRPLGPVRIYRWLALPAAVSVVLLSFSARFVLDPANAVLTNSDDWAYRSGWPSGVAYDAARQFINSTGAPQASVAYVVDDEHRIAMGLYARDASGSVMGEPFLLDPRIMPVLRAAQYVVLDDTRYDAPGERLRALRALAPELTVIARFANPNSDAYVTVLAPPHVLAARLGP